MNLVFVNSFEKRKDEGLIVQAQVSITEQRGLWQVVWNEPADNGEARQEVWYEGNKWQEMLVGFRLNLAEKAAEGYLPLIDGHTDEEWLSGKGGYSRMLQHYGEMHADGKLYEQLRQWRKEMAAKEKKPSYLFATNRVLQMMACYVPHTMEELAQIPGWGDQKRNLYGKEILAITGQHEQKTGFPLEWVPARVDMHDFRLWLHRQREYRTRTMLERKETKRRLLAMMADGKSLAEIAGELNMSRREAVLLTEELQGEGYAFDAWLDGALADMPAAEREKAWQVMQAEGDRFLKPILQKTYSEEELKERELEQLYEWLRLMRLLKRSRHASAGKAG